MLTVEAAGNIHFKYQYAFYFFVARRLARNLGELEIQERVRHMCQRLHVEEYSNIVLFLVHHSNDHFVLQTLREAANTLLFQRPAFGLNVTTENLLLRRINRLPSPLRTQTLEDRDHERVQQQTLEEKDVLEDEERRSQGEVEDDSDLREQAMNGLDVFAQAGIAAKTVDLLGQILRNYYGSLRLDTKLEIGKDAVDLALRAVFSFLELFGSRDFEIIKLLGEARREYEEENITASARMSDEELERWARDFVFALLGRVAEMVVERVAGALGWEQLRPTLEKLVSENGSLAYRMVKIAALLDGPGPIPRTEIDGLTRDLDGNPLGFQILRDLVAQRVYRYPTEYGDRQWLAAKLNFSMVGQRAADSDKGRRLLAS